MNFSIREISAAEARPIRHAILRPGKPFESTLWAGDDAPQTRHFGAFTAEQIIGAVTLLHVGWDGMESGNAWQIRGMAVLAEWQGHGAGTRLAERCAEHAHSLPGSVLWCNARSSARAFYERLGFRVEGEPFEIAGIGTHYRMIRGL